jgi:hypothetical protein
VTPRTRRFTSVAGLIVLGALTLVVAPASANWSPQYPKPEVESSESGLGGISCSSASACTAVGSYVAKSEPEVRHPLAERWTGSSWSPQSVPMPEKSKWAGGAGVSCPTAEKCMMVGTYIKEGTELVLPLAALWSSGKWTLQTLPVPEGTVYGGLESISCVSGTECVAVGQYTKEAKLKGMQPYIVKWNGTSWTRQIGGLPAGGNGGRLFSVSCVSSTNCVAGGSFYSIEIVEKEGKEEEVEVSEGSLLDTWNGSKWVGSHLGPGAIEGVSCPSAASCFSVSNTGNTWKFAESKWNEIEGPKPGAGASSSGVRALSCVSANACTAVGEYVETKYHLYISTWDGAKWTLQTSIEPAETGLGSLSGVSCTEASACIAVGASEYQAIAERSN